MKKTRTKRKTKTEVRTNFVLLYARIRELDMSIREVAIRAGINPSTMYSKLKKRAHLTDEEIAGLMYALELGVEDSVAIFLQGYMEQHVAV